MGQFIDQVGKNNQLQTEYLSYKRRLEEEKKREKREKQQEKQYQDILRNETKRALQLLDNYIEKEYKLQYTQAYYYLGKIQNRNNLINKVINDLQLEYLDINREDIETIKYKIKNQYNTIIKKYKNIYEQDLKIYLEELKEEAQNEQQQTKQTKNDLSILKKIGAFSLGALIRYMLGDFKIPKAWA